MAKAGLIFTSYDSSILDNFMQQIRDIASIKGIACSIIGLPTNKKLFCIQKSTFIYKHSMQHFYKFSHKRLVNFHFKDGQSLEQISSYLNIPASISVVNADRSYTKKQENPRK